MAVNNARNNLNNNEKKIHFKPYTRIGAGENIKSLKQRVPGNYSFLTFHLISITAYKVSGALGAARSTSEHYLVAPLQCTLVATRTARVYGVTP